MTGDDLIAALLARADNGRNENAVLPDALGGLLHGFIIPHLEGMIGEGVKLGQRERHDPFLRSMGGRRFVLRRFLAPFSGAALSSIKYLLILDMKKGRSIFFKKKRPQAQRQTKRLMPLLTIFNFCR